MRLNRILRLNAGRERVVYLVSIELFAPNTQSWCWLQEYTEREKPDSSGRLVIQGDVRTLGGHRARGVTLDSR
jgi:hypothetical protein